MKLLRRFAPRHDTKICHNRIYRTAFEGRRYEHEATRFTESLQNTDHWTCPKASLYNFLWILMTKNLLVGRK